MAQQSDYRYYLKLRYQNRLTPNPKPAMMDSSKGKRHIAMTNETPTITLNILTDETLQTKGLDPFDIAICDALHCEDIAIFEIQDGVGWWCANHIGNQLFQIAMVAISKK